MVPESNPYGGVYFSQSCRAFVLCYSLPRHIKIKRGGTNLTTPHLTNNNAAL